jgi:hypothetical protein
MQVVPQGALIQAYTRTLMTTHAHAKDAQTLCTRTHTNIK